MYYFLHQPLWLIEFPLIKTTLFPPARGEYFLSFFLYQVHTNYDSALIIYALIGQ